MSFLRLIIYCLFIVVLTSFRSTHGQTVILNKGQRHYIQRIGHSEDKALNPVGQQIIREYATALATNPTNLNTVFQCEISRDATIAANGEATVRLRIINGTIRGDASLKGFDVSDVLMPSAFNANVLLSTSSGDTLLFEQQRSLKLTRGSSAHLRFQLELPKNTDTVWFEVKDLNFFHERANVQQLISRIQKIADYYAADYVLKSMQKRLSSINCNQYDLLPQCFIVMMEVDRVLQHIGKANFSEHLSLGISDPAGMQRRFEIASNTYAYMMREFSNLLRQTNRIYLTQTEESLVLQYIEGIVRYIDDTPEAGFAAAPFINQLSTIEFSGKEFEQKANYFRQLAARINPTVPATQAATDLLSLVYNAMLNKASEYMVAVEFNKAVVLHENAGKFCEAFPEIECREDAWFELSKAKHGLYGFYLTVAERAIDMQRPDIASSYVFLAREYQRNNKRLIIHDGDVTIMLVKLFDAWVLEAAKYNQAERYDTALMILDRAMRPDIGITPSSAWNVQNAIALNGLLASRLGSFMRALEWQPLTITEAIYHNLVDFIKKDMMGVILSRANDSVFRNSQNLFLRQLTIAARSDIDDEYFEESMRKLILLRSIIGDRNTGISPEIDSLTLIAGREVISRMLRETVYRINQGKTDEGFDLYSQALLRIEQYGLQRDEITSKRLEDVYDAYIAIRCLQLQSRLDQVILQALRLASLQMFVLATDTLNASIKQVSLATACKLSLAAAQELISNYQYAADYQRSLQLADKALAQNDFIACLRHIDHAEIMQEQHNLRQFGLEPFTMLDYAVANSNTSLNWYIARRYVQLLRFDQAFRILALLKESGVTVSEAAEIQQELGLLVGIKDRSEVAFLKSFQKAKEYTGGGPWYKPFNKAYRKGLGFRFPWLF